MRIFILLFILSFIVSCSSLKRLERQANRGDIQACFRLVETYSSADYNLIDQATKNKIITYCKKGLELNPDTDYTAQFYHYLARASQENKTAMYSSYLKAAKLGYGDSQWIIGLYYLEGRGGKVKLDSAYYFIKKCSETTGYYQANATKTIGDILNAGHLNNHKDSLAAIYNYKRACACFGSQSDISACDSVISHYKKRIQLADTTDLSVYLELQRQLKKR